MKLLPLILILSSFCIRHSSSGAPHAELVSVKKIWDRAPHNGFTDLIRFHDQFFCCFREGLDHVGGDGVIRILASRDGEVWEDCAGVAEPGVDLRESKLEVTPDGMRPEIHDLEAVA